MCGNERLWHRESLTNQPRSLLPRILQHVNISALLLGCMSVYGCLYKKTTVNYLTTEGTSRGNANAVCISLIQVLWITCLSTAYWKKMWKMLLIGLFYIRDLLLAAPSRGHHSRWSASISHQPSSTSSTVFIFVSWLAALLSTSFFAHEAIMILWIVVHIRPN